MDMPKRKQNRLLNYDYSSPGCYFITVCTKNKEHLFGKVVVGASIARPYEMILSDYGKTVKIAIEKIPDYYSSVAIDNYVIMPNHIHLLLQIKATGIGRPMVAPTVSQIVQQLKGSVTKQIGFSPWQKTFHDHIIRDKADYDNIWNYIEYNTLKWESDFFYSEK